VRHGIEKVQFRVGGNLHEHDDAGGDDSQEGDDVHNANGVEDDVAGTGEGFGGERHFGAGWSGGVVVLVGGDEAEAVAESLEFEGEV
jgi:hypothetical protein